MLKMFKITSKKIEAFRKYLSDAEKMPSTINAYLSYIEYFMRWLEAKGQGQKFGKADVISWKNDLKAQGYAVSTMNLRITALNRFFRFLGWETLCVQKYDVQNNDERSEERVLTKDEYERLIRAADRLGRTRAGLLGQTIGSTGIRVSEVVFITVEAVREGVATVTLKGKTRRVRMPKALRKKLLKYAKRKGICSGPIFRTRSGKPMTRQEIWAELKSLCAAAGVDRRKVFPHNLRHLFACEFYERTHNMAKLADVLGHSSIQTTRLYLRTSAKDHTAILDSMDMVLDE